MLDIGTPVFPYLTYRPLLNQLIGREVTPWEEISIGVLAMMGLSLVDICNKLRKSKDIDNESASLIRQAASTSLKRTCEIILPLLELTRDEFSEGDHIYSAVNQFIILINEARDLRIKWPALESSFLDAQFNKNNYRKLIATFLDVCIMQDKPEQVAEFRWEGPGKIATDGDMATNLAILQASIHFVRLHLTADGSVAATSELRSERCPFSGACPREKELGNPELCITKPWRQFPLAKESKRYCLYAAGVSVLASNRSRVQMSAR
jgi:hypothetical protein